ncbi:MAG: hypothetical protein J7518_22015 [Nocardioidaceae bacterium]|nr:hypothetical protein [Nocardioidaceae bacterium]
MSTGPQAALIGDAVGSRGASDRVRLHARINAALEAVNTELRPSVPLRITVGDEYQGVFAHVGEAVSAALRLRLLLQPEHDVRHGIGWGRITVLSDEPRVEDGPGWWAAREAIEAVAHDQQHAQPHLRTAYRLADDQDGPDPAALNAALIARDGLLGAASPRSLGVLRGLLAGMSQTQIATAEAVSPSAISQRVRRDGLSALVACDRLLAEVR